MNSLWVKRTIPRDSIVARLLATLVCCSLAIGCTSSRVFQTAGTATPTPLVSDVEVTLDANFSPSPAYRSISMSGTIRHALIKELRRKKRLGPGGTTLEFVVTDFRLRTGSAVFWTGIMAGGDHVAGIVTLREGGTQAKTFDVSAKGIDSMYSGIFMLRLTSGSRADHFAKMLAAEIVDQL